ncbi:uncharacterized protein METZ01_LOCUS397136 [marine metagenome]|uniref:Uncharacterized protein n=1 Tax=marine metagenome TaxID=408172 RepID=A0A382VCM1_9ZZZZ
MSCVYSDTVDVNSSPLILSSFRLRDSLMGLKKKLG